MDEKLNRVGILSNSNPNATPFYNDSVTRQIADDDEQLSLGQVANNASAYDAHGNTKNWGHTLNSIYVPYGYPDTKYIRQGYSLAYQDPTNRHWYVMRLTHVSDTVDSSNVHYKSASGINLLIWKLGKTIHPQGSIIHANSNQAFLALLANTGWYLDPHNELVGSSSDLDFDGVSSNQSYLQKFCQLYGAEVDAFVQFDYGFHIAMKRVVVKQHLGKDNGDRIVYGRNATNITRTSVDDSLYTKIYVYGQNGATCAVPETNGKPFVKDDVANRIYNPPEDNNASLYLEGAVQSQSMKDPEGLYEWGKKQLRLFNHPRNNYTVGVALKETGDDRPYMPKLDDLIKVKDKVMQPEMTVEARVIRTQLSFANPFSNQVTLGEYTTVNVVPPDFIRNLQQGVSNHLAELLDDLRHNPSALSAVVEKPDGTSWGQDDKKKRFIAHVAIMGEDISPYIKPQGYIWNFYPSDDKGNKSGVPDDDFLQAHRNAGQTLVMDNKQTGTVKLTIDTDFIDDSPEVDFDTSEVSEVFDITKHDVNAWGDRRMSAIQYVNMASDGTYYASHVYHGRELKLVRHHEPGHHTEILHLDSDGNLMDSMVLNYSTHNGTFGLQEADGQVYIWTNVEDYAYNHQSASGHSRYWLARIAYQPNTYADDLQAYQLLKQLSENWVMAYYDRSSDMVLESHDLTSVNPQHDVNVYHASDLLTKKNDAEPFKHFDLVSYGFKPKNKSVSMTDNSSTFQSCCMKYPYFFWTSGNANMTDQRKVYCVNLKTNTLVFNEAIALDNFKGLGNFQFAEPETINIAYVGGNPVFLYGFNTASYDSKPTGRAKADDGSYHLSYPHVEQLYMVSLQQRDKGQYDGGDVDVNDD